MLQGMGSQADGPCLPARNTCLDQETNDCGAKPPRLGVVFVTAAGATLSDGYTLHVLKYGKSNSS